MPVAGKHRCGCDCKNQTTTADSTIPGNKSNLCCGSFSGNGTPPRYAVIFECEHDWPLYAPATGVCLSQHPLGFPVGVYPGIDSPCDGGGHPTTCPIPDGCVLTNFVMELKKDCLFNLGAFDSEADGGCMYSNKMYVVNGSVTGSCFAVNSIFSSKMVDTNNPGEGGRLFPPYAAVTGTSNAPLEYVLADYERDGPNPPIHWLTEAYDTRSWVTLWKLKFATDTPASLEWCYDYVLGRLGKSRPRYEAETTWDLWGRNTMVLQNPDEWPTLRRKICVKAIDKPKPDNPCETHEQRCKCCDPGGNGVVSIYVTGCDRVGGYYTFPVVRIDPAATGTGATPVPCGVVVPSPAPCKFFWGTFTPTGTPCPPSTGTGLTYTGQIGLAIHCTGSGAGPTGGPPIEVEAYCEYFSGTGTGEGSETCWDGPYSTTILSTSCFCLNWGFAFQFGELPCCCSNICCCDGAVPDTLTAEVTSDMSSIGGGIVTGSFPISGGGPVPGATWTGSGTVGGFDVTVTLSCGTAGDGSCTFGVTISCTIDPTTYTLLVTNVVCPPAFEITTDPSPLGFCFSGSPTSVRITL